MKTEEMDPSAVINVEDYFGLNLKLLSLIGLKCSFKKKVVQFTFIHRIPTIVSNIQGIIVLILEVYFIIDVYLKDMSLAMQIISQVVTNLQCISKGFLLMFTIDKMQLVLDEIQRLWLKYPPSDDHRIEILNVAHRTFTFCKFYFTVLIICMLSYVIPFTANLSIQYLSRESNNHTYDFSQRLLLMKYPFEVTSMSTYFLLVFQEGYLLYVSCIFWVSSDTLFAQITTHICLQIKIFKNDIEAIFSCENKQDNETLIDLVKRHRELLSICMFIEDIFSPIIFSTMLFSSLNMCVNVIGSREAALRGSYLETIIYFILLIITVLQILFYCTFAEKITEETRSLADSVYNSNWTTKDYKLRLYIQLIIMRAQKPFYCTAYGFFPIGHQKLTSIINTSFSYYMMLQTTSNM